ncbi:MAG: T9SS type A sorting domain-containing protein, partial [Tannerellaceae bacterium]|nr:T9SS type A sorting domain-containing protein [Tannerellaceae bacterium]
IVTVTKDDDNDDSAETVNSHKAEVTLADGILTVNSPAAEQVEVYSLTGALLHRESKASGSLTLNIGHLPKGILIVRGNSGWTQKIILK